MRMPLKKVNKTAPSSSNLSFQLSCPSHVCTPSLNTGVWIQLWACFILYKILSGFNKAQTLANIISFNVYPSLADVAVTPLAHSWLFLAVFVILRPGRRFQSLCSMCTHLNTTPTGPRWCAVGGRNMREFILFCWSDLMDQLLISDTKSQGKF